MIKIVVVLVIFYSFALLHATPLSTLIKENLNYVSTPSDFHNIIGLYKYKIALKEQVKNTNDDIANEMYNMYLKTYQNKSCEWEYSKNSSNHIFYRKCINIKLNKKYVISSDNVIVNYIPIYKKGNYNNRAIENLSYESVCCYNRVCTYLTITFDNNKVLSPFMPNLDILMGMLNITSD